MDYQDLLQFFPEVGTDQREIYILEIEPGTKNSLTFLSSNGYSNLYGMGMEDNIYDLPSHHKIKYTFGEPQQTHFPDNFFDVVISINFTHNNSDINFLEEMARILKNDGRLVVNMAYNNQLINSTEVVGEYFDIIPSKKNSCSLFALRCKKRNTVLEIREVYIIHPHIGMEDSQYYKHLQNKFLKEGIKAYLVENETEVPNNSIKVFELEAGQYFKLPEDKNCIVETHSIVINEKSLWISTKVMALNFLALFSKKFSKIKSSYLQSKEMETYYKDNLTKYPHLLLRTNEFGKYLGIDKFTLMPHISYDIEQSKKEQETEKPYIKIGSFGVAKKYKHFEKICELGIKLNVPVIIISTVVNEPITGSETDSVSRSLQQRYKNKENIEIITGYFTEEEISEKLSSCTHLIFAQDEGKFWTSGSMRFAASLGKPVIAKDSWQAREAQAIRVKKIDDITMDFLLSHTEPPHIADGYLYLKNFLQYQYNKQRIQE